MARITNKLNLPQPIVEAATGSHKVAEKGYSVTQVLKGVRQTILERRHADEIEEDAADCIWRIFGTAVHKVLEQAQESSTQLKEGYITADMGDGYTLSGIFDLYDDATGTVTDYKTATVWKVVYSEWDDYRRQILAYCWMLRQMGFDARRGQIVAILKDHSKAKAKREAGYPPYPVYTISWDFTDEEFEQAGAWLRERFSILRTAETLPDEYLPMCTPEERWHKPGKYAVMKKGRKRAVKLYDTETEAQIHAVEVDGYVEHRPGTDGRCADYCPAAPWCSHMREAVDEA